jgi:hypothetical protein
MIVNSTKDANVQAMQSAPIARARKMPIFWIRVIRAPRQKKDKSGLSDSKGIAKVYSACQAQPARDALKTLY